MKETTDKAAFRSGKYLTFKMDSVEYGVEILKVKEIMGHADITRVAETPDFVRGVINLRGAVIPVIDLRKKLSIEAAADTKETSIIIVEINKDGNTLRTGLLVDSVSDVADIPAEEIQETPSFGSGVSTESILGIAKVRGGIKIILNIDRLLGSGEIENIKEINGEVL